MDFNFNDFYRYEEEQRLFDLNINGYYYWPYIRMGISEDLRNTYMRAENNNFRMDNNTALQYRKFLKSLAFGLLKNPMLAKKDKDILFLTNSARLKFADGLYHCHLLDEIIDRFQDRCVVGEFPLNRFEHSEPMYTKKLYYFDLERDIPILYGKITNKYLKSKDDQEWRNVIRVLENIEQRFNLSLNKERYLNEVIQNAGAYPIAKKMLKKVLKHLSPKIIVFHCYYGYNMMILIEVAKELGIKTVEMQHGMICDYHAAYNFFSNADRTFLPDYFFAFSDFWERQCRLPRNTHFIPVGLPFYEMQRRLYPKKNVDDKKILRIVVLSQASVSKMLVDFTADMIAELKKHNVIFRVIYKLHPNEFSIDQSLWNKLRVYSEVEILNNSSASLYYCFSNADIQIAYDSTTIFEGLGYCLKTILVRNKNEMLDKIFQDLTEKKCAIVFDSGTACGRYLSKGNGSDNMLSEMSDIFFRKNAIDNICDEIYKILSVSD